jgi:hypothetical protein
MGKVKGIQRGRRSYADMKAEIDSLKVLTDQQAQLMVKFLATARTSSEEAESLKALAVAFGFKLVANGHHDAIHLFGEIEADMPDSYHRPAVAGAIKAIQNKLIDGYFGIKEE